MKDLELSYAEDWQKLHWKSIKIAYQSSPYFEYYEDKLKQIFSVQPTSLIEFNLNALKIILQILKVEKDFSLTTEFEKNTRCSRFKRAFFSQKSQNIILPEYYQTFSDKLGFIKDLSILDVVCNIYPESATYIKKVTQSIQNIS